MVRACGNQLRAGFGKPYGLDFNAPLALARAWGADRTALTLLAETLPAAEGSILAGFDDDDDGHDGHEAGGDL